MLASFQRQMDEQQGEVARERDKATLESDAAACVQNQLIVQIEIL